MKTKLVIALLLAFVLPTAALAERPEGQQNQQRRHHQRGILYTYAGTLAAAPSATGLTVDIERGNRPALKSLIGQSAQQTFTYDESTEFLLWSHGIPTVVDASALHAGDWVRVNVRASHDATLADITAKPAAIVGDHVTEPQRPDKPLFLFRGKLTAVGASSVTVNVTGGNKHALRLMIGQPAEQTFAFDADTIILLWQGKVPTVIGPSAAEGRRPLRRARPRRQGLDPRRGRGHRGRTPRGPRAAREARRAVARAVPDRGAPRSRSGAHRLTRGTPEYASRLAETGSGALAWRLLSRKRTPSKQEGGADETSRPGTCRARRRRRRDRRSGYVVVQAQHPSWWGRSGPGSRSP